MKKARLDLFNINTVIKNVTGDNKLASEIEGKMLGILPDRFFEINKNTAMVLLGSMIGDKDLLNKIDLGLQELNQKLIDQEKTSLMISLETLINDPKLYHFKWEEDIPNFEFSELSGYFNFNTKPKGSHLEDFFWFLKSNVFNRFGTIYELQKVYNIDVLWEILNDEDHHILYAEIDGKIIEFELYTDTSGLDGSETVVEFVDTRDLTVEDVLNPDELKEYKEKGYVEFIREDGQNE